MNVLRADWSITNGALVVVTLAVIHALPLHYYRHRRRLSPTRSRCRRGSLITVSSCGSCSSLGLGGKLPDLTSSPSPADAPPADELVKFAMNG